MSKGNESDLDFASDNTTYIGIGYNMCPHLD